MIPLLKNLRISVTYTNISHHLVWNFGIILPCASIIGIWGYCPNKTWYFKKMFFYSYSESLNREDPWRNCCFIKYRRIRLRFVQQQIIIIPIISGRWLRPVDSCLYSGSVFDTCRKVLQSLSIKLNFHKCRVENVKYVTLKL